MLGSLTHKHIPPQQDISIILYEKVVQLHINLIYTNSFQERTNSAKEWDGRGMGRGGERCAQGSGWQTWGKETIGEIQT